MHSQQSICLRGRHYSDTADVIEYQKGNPKPQKVFIFRKGKCDICGRIKSQIISKRRF